MASTRDLRVRLTPRQHERLKEIAKLNNKTISQYMRNLILEYDDANIVNKILETRRMVKDIHEKIMEERWIKKQRKKKSMKNY